MARRGRGTRARQARRHLLWLKEQEAAGIDIVTDGEQSRQHFVHGFLEYIEGIDFEHKVKMGIRNNLRRHGASGSRAAGAEGRVHQQDAVLLRRTTKHKVKITMLGPMTLVDTTADRHYGDTRRLAMAFTELLSQEARVLEKDGVDVIQLDEPAFSVYTKT